MISYIYRYELLSTITIPALNFDIKISLVLAYEDATIEDLGKAGDARVRVEIMEQA